MGENVFYKPTSRKVTLTEANPNFLHSKIKKNQTYGKLESTPSPSKRLKKDPKQSNATCLDEYAQKTKERYISEARNAIKNRASTPLSDNLSSSENAKLYNLENVSPVKLNSKESSVRRNLNTDFELKKSISEEEYDIPDDVIPHETTDELLDKQLNALKNKDYNQRLLNQEIAFRMKGKKIHLRNQKNHTENSSESSSMSSQLFTNANDSFMLLEDFPRKKFNTKSSIEKEPNLYQNESLPEDNTIVKTLTAENNDNVGNENDINREEHMSPAKNSDQSLIYDTPEPKQSDKIKAVNRSLLTTNNDTEGIAKNKIPPSNSSLKISDEENQTVIISDKDDQTDIQPEAETEARERIEPKPPTINLQEKTLNTNSPAKNDHNVANGKDVYEETQNSNQSLDIDGLNDEEVMEYVRYYGSAFKGRDSVSRFCGTNSVPTQNQPGVVKTPHSEVPNESMLSNKESVVMQRDLAVMALQNLPEEQGTTTEIYSWIGAVSSSFSNISKQQISEGEIETVLKSQKLFLYQNNGKWKLNSIEYKGFLDKFKKENIWVNQLKKIQNEKSAMNNNSSNSVYKTSSQSSIPEVVAQPEPQIHLKEFSEVGPRSEYEISFFKKHPEQYISQRRVFLNEKLKELRSAVAANVKSTSTVSNDPVYEFTNFQAIYDVAKRLEKYQMDMSLAMKYRNANKPFKIQPERSEAQMLYDKYGYDDDYYVGTATGLGNCKFDFYFLFVC